MQIHALTVLLHKNSSFVAQLVVKWFEAGHLLIVSQGLNPVPPNSFAEIHLEITLYLPILVQWNLLSSLIQLSLGELVYTLWSHRLKFQNSLVNYQETEFLYRP